MPKRSKGKLFNYIITKYNDKKKYYEAEYGNRMIHPVDAEWIHDDGGREPLVGLSAELVETGRALFVTTANLSNTRNKDKEEAAKAVLSLKKHACAGVGSQFFRSKRGCKH